MTARKEKAGDDLHSASNFDTPSAPPEGLPEAAFSRRKPIPSVKGKTSAKIEENSGRQKSRTATRKTSSCEHKNKSTFKNGRLGTSSNGSSSKTNTYSEPSGSEAELRSRLAGLFDRPTPPSVDWGAKADLELPDQLSDEQYREIVLAEENSKPSQVLTRELFESAVSQQKPSGTESDSSGAGLAWRTHIRLDRMRLSDVEPGVLSLAERLTNLYLQHNRLTAVPDLRWAKSLRFLTLSGNRISEVSSLAELPCLMFLDISHNRIGALSAGDLPPSLRFLEVDGNPCMEGRGGDDLVIEMMALLPEIKSIDGMGVGPRDRSAARRVGSPIPAALHPLRPLSASHRCRLPRGASSSRPLSPPAAGAGP
mmetsp:Transcript_30468/g.72532  ORF Transcript_30468/g.72532 Transcript_30468/m.72532 type:complete len:367 (+) Transcript_30468:171-1271(+)